MQASCIKQAETESERSALFSVTRSLAEKSLLAWHKAGEAGEPYLLAALKGLSDAAILPMTTELIDELVAGGMVPYSEQMGAIRDQSTRLVTNIFPDFSGALEDVLRRTIRLADGGHLPFVLDVLGHYEGNLAIHPICKEIVDVLPLEDDLLGQLQIVLWNAGLLAGEFGHVLSLKEKRASMEEWLSDSREKVRLFAREVMEDYEKEMTSEQQRAENDVEMRRLRYEEPADVEPSTKVRPGDEDDPGRLG